MMVVNEKKLLELIDKSVEKYMKKHIDQAVRKNIDDRVQVIFNAGNYLHRIIQKINLIAGQLFSGKLESELNVLIKKHHPPKIIYVQEQKEIPDQLLPFGVKEYLLPPVCPCIYFLCRDNRVVYIGQSINLASRLGQHVLNKYFDRIFYFEVAAEDLNKTEAELIDYYDPELNKTGVKGEDKVHHERQRR